MESEPLKMNEPSMGEFFDRIYDDFNTYAEKDSVVPFSEFQKYEILYSSKERERFLNKEMSAEESEEIGRLSEEWYKRVNTRRPIHIVDDVTGAEVCPPLPPIFNTLKALDSLDAYNRISALAMSMAMGETGGVMHQIKSRELAVDVNNMFAANQDPEEMRKHVDEFTKLATEFDRKVLGKTKPNAPASATTDETSTDDANPDLDFFDEEE